MKYSFAFALGLLSWPFLEYILHRFLGHVLKMNTLFKKEHTRHHVETNYFAPLFYKILASIPICTVTMTFSSVITSDWKIGLGYTIGFISMYTVYEWVHWSFHARAPKTKLGLRLRKHHFAHHFQNPKMNHGVTTTIIDRIAGTYIDVETIKVPKSIVLPWLLKKDEFAIDAKYAKDFQLR